MRHSSELVGYSAENEMTKERRHPELPDGSPDAALRPAQEISC
ncbi:MAG: hypothetical protein ACOYKA_06170 [Legionellaceae bacterium]